MTLSRRGALVIACGFVVAGCVATVGVGRVRTGIEAERRWALVSARKGLRVGIDPNYRPFSTFSEEGWTGLDADLARALALRMGLQLWSVPVGYDGFYDALRADQIDIAMSALVGDPSRTAEVAFTRPYFEAGLVLVGACRPLGNAPACLVGQRLAVALGSEADRQARLWERRTAGLARVPVNDEAAALDAVDEGRADAALVDALEVWSALSELRRRDASRVASIRPREFSLAVRSDDTRLLAELNAQIDALEAVGALSALERRWLSGQR